MKRGLILLAVVALAAAPRSASAQEGGDPAWSLYHAAFSAVAKGEREVARARLADLVERYPDHPVAVRAIEALALLEGKTGVPDVDVRLDKPAPPDLRHEGKSKSARAELALVQTIHGIAIGVELCMIATCDDPGAFVGTILIGATAGVLGSIFLTRDGITDGQRATANSGTLWGAWNGAMLLAIMENDGGGESVETAGLVLAGTQLAGLGAGVLVGQTLKPTDGQVALANTCGLWTGVVTLFAHETFEIDFSSNDLLTALLITTDGALLAGAYLGKRYPMSRGRTLVIDAGGVVGMMAGFGLVTLIQGEDADAQLAFGAGLTGTIVGLATATWFTRRWDF